jgi:uncharacterized protein (DUF2132 family)
MTTQNTSVSTGAAFLQGVCIVLGLIFFVTGILNAWLVHIVPGIFYVVLSLLYIPHTNALLKQKLGFTIPLALLVVLGFVVLWGTLAVGDLAEILGL